MKKKYYQVVIDRMSMKLLYWLFTFLLRDYFIWLQRILNNIFFCSIFLKCHRRKHNFVNVHLNGAVAICRKLTIKEKIKLKHVKLPKWSLSAQFLEWEVLFVYFFKSIHFKLSKLLAWLSTILLFSRFSISIEFIFLVPQDFILFHVNLVWIIWTAHAYFCQPTFIAIYEWACDNITWMYDYNACIYYSFTSFTPYSKYTSDNHINDSSKITTTTTKIA